MERFKPSIRFLSSMLDASTGAGAAAPAAPSPSVAPARPVKPIPEDALIVLPLRDAVVFPNTVVPLLVGRTLSQAAVQEAVRQEKPVGALLQSKADVDDPRPDELHWVGTSVAVMRYLTAPDGSHHLVGRGVRRFRVLQFLEGWPFPVAQVQYIDDPARGDPEIEGRARALKDRAMQTLQLLPQVPAEMSAALQALEQPAQLADAVCSVLDIPVAEKQSLLETFDLKSRLDRLLAAVTHRLEVLKVSRDVADRTRESIGDVNRKHLLREQMRVIQKELGEDDENSADIAELDAAIAEAGMPDDVEKAARKELKRLERMPEAAAEHSMVRTYLEWLTELPWRNPEPAGIDIPEARRILDADHFGLEKIKRRILEHLAVHKLNPSGRSPILCFAGPPGVGKTSLGQSIAKATGRAFQRVSLGGVHDESEIRGHRRTYIGALPGNIVQALRKAGTRHTLIMLDEIDKLGAGGVHGDPAAALLEVLDPEQNNSFRDTYLAVPYDLSKVMFVCTANMLDTIPGPLRDRMEVIQLPGYTNQEKLEIARRYLLPRQLAAAGLTEAQCRVTDAALAAIVADYTREAGVRNLEREVGSVCRHVAVRVAEGSVTAMTVDAADLPAVLGPKRFEAEVAMRAGIPGVATGLAWTPVGGEILFIEAARTAGSGRLILTGQLGDVMKESVQAALSLVKGRAGALGIAAEALDRADVHVHVPAGATPKDGPSAGVAMFVALTSLLSGRPVRADVAMTGEISLRGLVLPVGGIKEKVLAALRAGIKTVMLPARNRRDLEDIPQEARAQLEFVWLERVDEAVALALEPAVAVTQEEAAA
ncbi:endopeptidase La [Azohydromonas lata]|uniref:endopeptidase La n=1 Tax=Azohydromonas lata TaxID=45677 RepID=UPI000B03323A|nr:endopeptidase La [Azohydromonas lata]